MATSRMRDGEYRPLGFAAEAVALRAERLRREGRHLAAALEWRAVVRIDSKDSYAALRWADSCIRGGQRGRAAEAYLTAATIFAGAGEPRRAMVLARRAMEIEPAEVISARIGIVVHACGREAEALCETAARAHVAAGRFDRARELRELLVECDPGSVTKTLLVAEIEHEHGDPSRAAHQLTAAASRMHATGRTGEYVRIAETMLAHGRHDPETTLELVRIYLRRGQAAAAVTKLELLLRHAPARLEIVELLVRCHAALGDTAAALRLLENTLRRRGHDEITLGRLCERAEAFDSRDPGFAAAVRLLRNRPMPVHRSPPPPPLWARSGRGVPCEPSVVELQPSDAVNPPPPAWHPRQSGH